VQGLVKDVEGKMIFQKVRIHIDINVANGSAIAAMVVSQDGSKKCQS
jgi:hypothetical protein